LDLHVPGTDTETFLTRSGLQLSLHKGGYVLSKRLSRVMRPFWYWRFFDEAEVTIDYNELLDEKLWDGSGLVSRGFIQRLADSLDLDDRHHCELLHTDRFEVTTLHAGGQDKGHVLVVDDLPVRLQNCSDRCGFLRLPALRRHLAGEQVAKCLVAYPAAMLAGRFADVVNGGGAVNGCFSLFVVMHFTPVAATPPGARTAIRTLTARL